MGTLCGVLVLIAVVLASQKSLRGVPVCREEKLRRVLRQYQVL